ncbi:hypothetical protein [Streptomyces mirabilis]|uniref:hypothetical protein n=2 Tax=Streptomyces TaxID=1883 RepID=UPI0036971742
MLTALKFIGISGALALMFALALVAGLVVGLLDWMDHQRVVRGILRGMKAFVAAIGLQLGVAAFIGFWLMLLFFGR